jgi:hypothetical protein
MGMPYICPTTALTGRPSVRIATQFARRCGIAPQSRRPDCHRTAGTPAEPSSFWGAAAGRRRAGRRRSGYPWASKASFRGDCSLETRQTRRWGAPEDARPAGAPTRSRVRDPEHRNPTMRRLRTLGRSSIEPAHSQTAVGGVEPLRDARPPEPPVSAAAVQLLSPGGQCLAESIPSSYQSAVTYWRAS